MLGLAPPLCHFERDDCRMVGACALTVVVPVRNEAGNPRPLHKALETTWRGMDDEGAVVDDSTDAVTRPLLRQIVAEDGRRRVLERPAHAQTGLATAVAEGLRAAVCEAGCVMDADIQHPPEVILQLLKAIVTGADLAVASRYLTGGSASGLPGRLRKEVSQASSTLTRALFAEARRTTDSLSGFFCSRRAIIDGLELRPIGSTILLELLVRLPRITAADVPFTLGSRNNGESKATLSQGILLAKHLLSLFVFVPLSALIGKVAISAALGVATFAIVLEVLNPLSLPAPEHWIGAFLVSLITSLALYDLVTLRSTAWRSLLAQQRSEWLEGYASAAVGLISFAALMARAKLATAVLALLAQFVALVLAYGLARIGRLVHSPAEPNRW